MVEVEGGSTVVEDCPEGRKLERKDGLEKRCVVGLPV